MRGTVAAKLAAAVLLFALALVPTAHGQAAAGAVAGNAGAFAGVRCVHLKPECRKIVAKGQRRAPWRAVW